MLSERSIILTQTLMSQQNKSQIGKNGKSQRIRINKTKIILLTRVVMMKMK